MAAESKDRAEEILNLNFVPEWVNRPVNPYTNSGEDFPSGKPERRRGRESNRRHDRRGDSRKDRHRGRQRPTREQAGRPRRQERREQRPSAPADPCPQVNVTFIPDRAGLATLIKRIAGTGRAYSLFDLAGLILSKPAFHTVKLELNESADGSAQLHQCAGCQMVFITQSDANDHAFTCMQESVYDVERREGDPPSGNFACVVRCKLSGTLLGPPNHHDFNDAVRELHRSRFGNMTLADYRRNLETLHDEEQVEAWKNATRTRTVWSVRDSEIQFERKRDAEAHFREHHLEKSIRSARKYTMPGSVSVTLDARNPLNRAIRGAWGRENRFPLKLSIALRSAFKHHNLHIFKSHDGSRFVTAHVPAPVDPATTVDDVRAVLEYLSEHPGCKREPLSEALGGGDDTLRPLHWLIDRGHVIEFSDGRLSVPQAAKKKA